MPPVIVGIMWRLVYQPDAGLLSNVIYKLGFGDTSIDWLSNLSTALPAVIVVGVWAGMPQTTVVLLAGLQSVPLELHEAAAVDGAGAWRRFRTVTLPALRPVIVAITSLDFIWNFNSFGLVYVLTDGGPGGKTTLPMLFAYQEAFQYGQFGYAAALGNVMVADHRGAARGLPAAPDAGGDSMNSRTNDARPGVAVRRPRRLPVFLGFPLLWMLSTAFKGPRELVELHPSLMPVASDAGQLQHGVHQPEPRSRRR